MQPPANQDSKTPTGMIQPAQPPAGRPLRRRLGACSGHAASPRREAAAALIGDESQAVRRALSDEFGQAGSDGERLLRRASRSNDARIRSHARALLDGRVWNAGRLRFLRYAMRSKINLEAGLWRLSSLERPGFDARPYRKALDAMAREIVKRSAHLADPLERGKVLVDYLGLELGYSGDMESYSSPDNVYLHRVIERKLGLPLSLSALYSFVARRAGLRTGIVPLPGHVMLRLYGLRENLIIDPFHGGETRTQESLRAYLAEHGLRFKPLWFRSAPDGDLLRRQVANLKNALYCTGQSTRARRLDTVLDMAGGR